MFRGKANIFFGIALLIVTSLGYLNFLGGESQLEYYSIFLWILFVIAIIAVFFLILEFKKDSEFLKFNEQYRVFPKFNKKLKQKNLFFFIFGSGLNLLLTWYVFSMVGELGFARFGVIGVTILGTYGLGFVFSIFE